MRCCLAIVARLGNESNPGAEGADHDGVDVDDHHDDDKHKEHEHDHDRGDPIAVPRARAAARSRLHAWHGLSDGDEADGLPSGILRQSGT